MRMMQEQLYRGGTKKWTPLGDNDCQDVSIHKGKSIRPTGEASVCFTGDKDYLSSSGDNVSRYPKSDIISHQLGDHCKSFLNEGSFPDYQLGDRHKKE